VDGIAPTNSLLASRAKSVEADGRCAEGSGARSEHVACRRDERSVDLRVPQLSAILILRVVLLLDRVRRREQKNGWSRLRQGSQQRSPRQASVIGRLPAEAAGLLDMPHPGRRRPHARGGPCRQAGFASTYKPLPPRPRSFSGSPSPPRGPPGPPCARRTRRSRPSRWPCPPRTRPGIGGCTRPACRHIPAAAAHGIIFTPRGSRPALLFVPDIMYPRKGMLRYALSVRTLNTGSLPSGLRAVHGGGLGLSADRAACHASPARLRLAQPPAVLAAVRRRQRVGRGHGGATRGGDEFAERRVAPAALPPSPPVHVDHRTFARNGPVSHLADSSLARTLLTPSSASSDRVLRRRASAHLRLPSPLTEHRCCLSFTRASAYVFASCGWCARLPAPSRCVVFLPSCFLPQSALSTIILSHM
jgi:hypothetical protein